MRTNNKHKKYENSFEQDFHLAYITRNVKYECNKKKLLQRQINFTPRTKIVLFRYFRVEFEKSAPLNFAKWKVSCKTKKTLSLIPKLPYLFFGGLQF